MRYPRRACWLLIVATAMLWFAASRHVAAAAEPAEAFLQGLKDRGLRDVALAYLDQMQTSPLCPKEFGETIDYEAGVLLVAEAESIRSVQRRGEKLDAARDRLQKFLSQHPEHELALSSTTQLANVLVERGRMMVEEAVRPRTTPEQKTELLDRARELYGRAKEVFAESERHYVRSLKSMPTGPIGNAKSELLEARQQARADLVQSRLFLATVDYETAMTYPPESPFRKQWLNQAAEQYHGLYDKYGNWLAGLYARLWEGRCYKELEEYDKALLIFEELLSAADDRAAFGQMKNRALILGLQTCVHPDVKQYKKAADFFDQWQDFSGGEEFSSSDALAIKYLAADAKLRYAQTLEKDDPQRRDSIAQAGEMLEFVGHFAGDYQSLAHARLSDRLLDVKAKDPDEPSTFAEAQSRAKAALENIQTIQTRDKLQRDQGEIAEHQKNLAKISQEQAEAIKYFQMALAMASPQTTVEELNIVRYYLAYLYWTSGDIYRAAVMGEFLAVRYPRSSVGRQAAKIVMAAYAKLYRRVEPGGPGQEFANRRMADMAEYITRLWPNDAVADEAWMTLLRLAASSGRLPQAFALFERLPQDSRTRSKAELLLGRFCWADYLRDLRLDENARPPDDQLSKKLARAERLLSAGIEHSRAETVDALLFAAVLSLAQIRLLEGDAAAALELLDDEKCGAHTLVKRRHTASLQPGLDIETYKTALRAYVRLGDLDKAETTIVDLEKAVAAEGESESAAKLTRIYIGLARELQLLLQDARTQNNNQQPRRLIEGFTLLLDRIRQQTSGNSFNSLNWTAEAFFNLASRFDSGGPKPTAKAEECYQRAADTYRTILRQCKQQAAFAPHEDAIYSIKTRLAECLARLGRYETAMHYLLAVLVKRNAMIDAQVQAAQTLQAWAAATGGANRYRQAIEGGYRSKKTGENVVWGWLKISRIAATSKQHADIFHQARYNLARCQTNLAMTMSGQKRANALRAAAKGIMRLRMLYPTLGGPEWEKKYDTQLKKIETLVRPESPTRGPNAPAGAPAETGR